MPTVLVQDNDDNKCTNTSWLNKSEISISKSISLSINYDKPQVLINCSNFSSINGRDHNQHNVLRCQSSVFELYNVAINGC